MQTILFLVKRIGIVRPTSSGTNWQEPDKNDKLMIKP